jgi:minor extracellular serine protease Vpr
MRKLNLHVWSACLLVLCPVLVAQRVPGRYIVELTSEPVADHVAPLNTGKKVRSMAAMSQLRSAAAQSYRARIQAEHVTVQRGLEQRNAKVLGSIDTVANAMFVRASDADVAKLAAVPGVKRVVPVRKVHMLLDRAVVLHHVVDAWNQIGSEKAGAGMKIAIIDTGIDITHPGMQDSSLTPPDSFPRAGQDSDLQYTNGKVIVARSYVDLLPNDDPDFSAQDHVGHGTALAMTAAGARNVGPLATITGVAPKAYLGNYKVFGTPGSNDFASDDAILKAMDDAVADGMDVINLSLGSDFAPRLEDDVDVQAVERASKAGVIVVVAAGNNGPDLNTIASPATAPSAIAVGAITNDRTFGTSAQVSGLDPFMAFPGDGPTPDSDLTAPIADVAKLDDNGLACSSLPSNSLKGKIALILRGTCTFEAKINNAQNAGAVGVLVYAAEGSPDPINMAVGSSTLPAEMVSHDAGVAIKQRIDSDANVTATLGFTLGPVSVAGSRVTIFTAAGPNVDNSIKPDIMAVGQDFYTATQTLDPNGDMYDPSGYVLVDGTSFSTPLIAGAAALIKGARPGLTVDQYRSLLINTAAAAQTQTGDSPVIQQVGGGLLDANAALNATATAYPALLSFGAGGSTVDFNKVLTVTNVGASNDTFTITAAPRTDSAAPSIGNNTIQLAAGASVDVPITWSASDLAKGTYEGTVNIVSAATGTQVHVPYWYAVTGAPAHVTVLSAITSGRRNRNQTDAIDFRVTDVSGVALPDVEPTVTVMSGGGTVRSIYSEDTDIPGAFGVDLRLGPTAGTNVFRIQVGDAYTDVTISGQ